MKTKSESVLLFLPGSINSFGKFSGWNEKWTGVAFTGVVREITILEGETQYPVPATLGLLDVTEEEVTKTGVETLEATAKEEDEEKNLHVAVVLTQPIPITSRHW